MGVVIILDPYARSGPLRSAYTRYATALHRKLQSSNLPPPVPMLIRKGTMLVWAANTIHGGANVTDFARTLSSSVPTQMVRYQG